MEDDLLAVDLLLHLQIGEKLVRHKYYMINLKPESDTSVSRIIVILGYLYYCINMSTNSNTLA